MMPDNVLRALAAWFVDEATIEDLIHIDNWFGSLEEVQ